ncbi:ribosome-associated heat shock protein implicated in recycling of 50S subunit [Beggiatoa alba B18LD]|uniref:Heat shock protein 15 n=1 Tax=Beggiatoa alba B18LD TaxID=395493 RepID=I3CGJ2_9GAMM|nr:S4 domain-containing protein [Beggiatoa alba]EIJ42735.1 ribosome-associated heat shock protein implicated in recycling of 50S subunit [Beggiatoa alba B18LD]
MRDEDDDLDDKVRLDKWLWAARFFKTRSLAIDAITGGKVHINQQRTKPAKEVHIGDEVRIQQGYFERTVIIKGLLKQRRPAAEAALLYEETTESLAKRQTQQEQHQLERLVRPTKAGRPTKRDRRLIHRFTQDEGGKKD